MSGRTQPLEGTCVIVKEKEENKYNVAKYGEKP
jgi:hypothetical protein